MKRRRGLPCADGILQSLELRTKPVNPDLVDRLRYDAPLNEADPTTFYGGDATGYTDYPVAERL